MKQRIAIYARVSTIDKQDYQRQITELTTEAQRNGFQDSQIDIYAEKVSGYKNKEQRPEMDRLLTEVKTNPKKYSVVYVLEISRIARKSKIIREVIDILTDNKIPLYIKNLGLYTLDADGKESIATNIIIAVFSEIADEYARTFKANSKSGLLQAAKSGKAGGGLMLPYGYTKDENKILQIEPEEAKVVETIFEYYKKGYGIKVISNIMNERGIPTRMNKTHAGKVVKFNIEKDGKDVKWSDKQIHDIIRNTIYIGQRRYKGELLKSPAIISSDLFQECQELLKGKTHRNYLTSYTYLLKDLCTCGVCGRNMFGRYKPVAGGDKTYICSSRLTKGEGCENSGVNIQLLESSIFNELISSDRILKYINDSKDVSEKLKMDIDRIIEAIKADRKGLKDKEREKERLLDVFVSGVIKKDTYTAKNTKIETEISTLTNRVKLQERELADKKDGLVNLSKNKTTKKILENAATNRGQLQTIYRQFVHRVIVNSVDKENTLVTIWLKINGDILSTPINLLLDTSGVRRKPMQFRYKSTFGKDSKLAKTPAKVLQEFNLPWYKWNDIKTILQVA